MLPSPEQLPLLTSCLAIGFALFALLYWRAKAILQPPAAIQGISYEVETYSLVSSAGAIESGKSI